MDVLMNFLTLVAVLAAAWFSSIVFGYVKKIPKVGALIDGLSAKWQQIGVLATAAAMVWAGSFLNSVLPESMALFPDPNTAALLAAAIAYGIHTKKK